jgi:hypothetical protein
MRVRDISVLHPGIRCIFFPFSSTAHFWLSFVHVHMGLEQEEKKEWPASCTVSIGPFFLPSMYRNCVSPRLLALLSPFGLLYHLDMGE